MGGFRNSLVAACALVAMPAPAAAADLCAALNRIIASSRETPAFASVRRALENGEAIVPGFGASSCRVAPVMGIDCAASSVSVDHFEGWPDVGACLGVEAEAARSVLPPRRDWTRTYVASGLRFAYGVHCLGCAGPATSRFTVIIDGQRRRGD